MRVEFFLYKLIADDPAFSSSHELNELPCFVHMAGTVGITKQLPVAMVGCLRVQVYDGDEVVYSMTLVEYERR